MNEDKNAREDSEKLNFETESECWFEKLLRLYTNLSIYLSTYLPTYLSIYLPIYLSICLSI